MPELADVGQQVGNLLVSELRKAEVHTLPCAGVAPLALRMGVSFTAHAANAAPKMRSDTAVVTGARCPYGVLASRPLSPVPHVHANAVTALREQYLSVETRATYRTPGEQVPSMERMRSVKPSPERALDCAVRNPQQFD